MRISGFSCIFFSIWKTILCYCESASDKAVAIRLFQVFLAFELVKILGYNGKLLTFFPWDAFLWENALLSHFIDLSRFTMAFRLTDKRVEI